MSRDLNEIKDIENKYGLILFRMGLTHLIDAGHRNLDDESAAECIRQILEKAENDTEHRSIMTPDFQCNVVRCAAELAKFAIWDLIAYIKKYVTVN